MQGLRRSNFAKESITSIALPVVFFNYQMGAVH